MTVKLNNDLCLVYIAANQVYCPGLRPQRHTCSSSVSLLLPTAASCDSITNYEPPDGGRIYRSALYQLHTNIPSHPTVWSHRTPRSFTRFYALPIRWWSSCSKLKRMTVWQFDDSNYLLSPSCNIFTTINKCDEAGWTYCFCVKYCS